MQERLPPELWLDKALPLLARPALLRLAGTTRAWRRAVLGHVPLWTAVAATEWPTHLLPALPAPGPPGWPRYRQRLAAGPAELTLACERCAFVGATVDGFNGNRTPARAWVRLRADGGLEGVVQAGQGSLHNRPATGLWRGSWRPAEAGWELEWSEQLPTNRGRFVYRAGLSVERPGELKGAFHWSVMPRKGGSFEFGLQRLPDGCKVKLTDHWTGLNAPID